VDDYGNKVQIGQQQDVTEYLLNFMERLEEGLNEVPPEMNQHVRVSTYLKRKPDDENGERSESFFEDTAVSTMMDESTEGTVVAGAGHASGEEAGYSKIDDSFFQHVKPQLNDPVVQKKAHLNTIYENLFGSHITVTKLLNKETGKEKIISKHK